MMSTVGQRERATQERVIRLFQDHLNYTYLGNWTDRNNNRMTLYVQPGTLERNKEKVLLEWYRRQLKTLIPDLIAKWEPVIGVQVSQWGIKKLKTRWGACNIAV
jgi:predicted metal-dependent hydrolase